MAQYHKRIGYWKEKCDTLFSEIVRLRANGLCQETNGKEFPQCAHIISRDYKNTCWDLDNAICLSRNRHKFYTHRPLEWEVFVDKLLGLGYHNKMKQRALNYRGWTFKELKDLYARLKIIRDSWDVGERRFRVYTNPGRAGFESQESEITGSESAKEDTGA